MTQAATTRPGTPGGSWSPRLRIPALDGLRGLAIGLVMLHHFFQSHRAEPVVVDRVAFGLAGSGWSGVDLFFVLSGFLITGILYDSKGDPNYYRNFYGRRTLRIFPLYYAVLLIVYVGFPLVPHPLPSAYAAASADDQIWFWFYLTNFAIALQEAWYPTFIPTVMWSLAIEEQFYLVWPVLVLLVPGGTLLRICLGLFVAALAIRVILALAGFDPIATFVLTFARMDCLALGALLALVPRTAHCRDRAVWWAERLGPACLLGLIALALPHGTLEWKDPWTNTIGFSLLALLAGSMLVRTVHGEPGTWLRTIFETGFLRMLGKYSYALYLLHGPTGTIVKQLFEWESVPLLVGSALPRVMLYTLVTTLLSLFLAWLSWNLLERHFLALQRFFRSPDPARSPGQDDAPVLRQDKVRGAPATNP